MSGVIDLRSPTVRGAWQLSLGFMDTVSTPSPRPKPYQEHRGRAETEALLLNVLRAAAGPLSRREIARALGRSKSPWLIQLIESLADRGHIIKGLADYRGFECWKYRVVQ